MQFSLTPVTVQGCLSQYVYRRVQAQGLQRDYATHHELSLQIRMIPAMACIPVANIPLHLKRYNMIPQNIQPIVDHFEDVFIGRARRHGRRDPGFPHCM